MTKRLGSVVLAVLVMGSAMAAPASASLRSELGTVTHLHGSQATENVFTFNNRTVKCKKATFSGEMSGAGVSAVLLEPSYGECTAFGLEATVNMNGCAYELETFLVPFGGIDILCPLGKSIVVNAAKGTCVVEMTQQFEAGTADYTNEGSGSTQDVLVSWTTPKVLDYWVSGSVLLCGTNGPRFDGSYSGTVTLKGYETWQHVTQVGIRSE